MTALVSGRSKAAWGRRVALGLGLLILLLRPTGLRAQVLDDSTKQVYGPKTTRVIYEAELLRDSTRGTLIDTSLTRWPQARFWFHDSTFQQDLGNVGTASRPLLYRPNLALGDRFGRNVFDRYARDASRVPYYDSRSPYSFFRYVQTGAGEQVFEISYSRSLRKNFSIGAAYERFAGNQALGGNVNRGLTENNNVLLFGRYQTEDGRYHLLTNITISRHQAAEQGGIRPIAGLESPNAPDSLFNYSLQQVNLTTATNEDDRDQFHLTQTYRLLGRGLTAFHTFDIRRQYNSFLDTHIQPTTAADNTSRFFIFYPDSLHGGVPTYNSAATLDRAEFRQAETTLGVLGRTSAVEYRLYARRSDDELVSHRLKPGATGTTLALERAAATYRNGQIFAGGTAAFRYRQVFAVETSGELKLEDDREIGSGGSIFGGFLGEYWLRGAIRTGPFSAEVLRTSYAPTLTEREFVGNHYRWKNSFHNTTADHLTVALQQKLPGGAGHSIELSGSIVNLSQLVYYDQQGVPAQRGDAQQLLIGFARHQIRLGHMGFDNQATYTRGGTGDVLGVRVPALVTDSRIYYQNYLFRRALLGQIGVEVYYQSRFKAYDYSPSTQQFYLQDHFTIRNYAIADAFFTADIGRVSLFVKLAYLNQGILYNGYYASPFYTGLPRRVQLGVRWRFFN